MNANLAEVLELTHRSAFTKC